MLALPIIDAFGRPLKIEQIWLPKLTINNNFRDVARFDRCTTCHQGLDKTLPGSAVEPLYPHAETLDVVVQGPAEQPPMPEPDPAEKDLPASEKPHWTPEEQMLSNNFGMHLAELGVFSPQEVSVSVVRPMGPAAKGGLASGDVILAVNGATALDRSTIYRYMVNNVAWGKPVTLKVRRGLPNPYASHPRLDLFVGSLSPHKAADIGCTICHEGQGIATSFKWASHSPSSPMEGSRWKHDHGWFNNHHWIFPMNPLRFAESGCLKCHHDVVELEPSERFPEPPAPKLLAGYELIRENGCYGCHEINGYDGPKRRIGPDMRAEPNYSAAAQALLAAGELNETEQQLADRVVVQPEDDKARRQLLESLKLAASPTADADGKKVAPRLSGAGKLANVLDDVESPGKLRKVGPSLRHVAAKLDFDFLYSWIRKPADFRPSTKMPQFFGLWEHLDGTGLDVSKKLEPIEIRGITEYLLAKTTPDKQPFQYAEVAESVTEQASAERGKQLFETRGCLACHKHADFPNGKMHQGPDLTNLGGKLGRSKEGRRWLYSWLRNPSAYHPRTLMPNLILDPIDDGKGAISDPAADLAEYLLASKDWQPQDIPSRQLTAEEQEALWTLAFDHLKDAYPKRKATEYLKNGIPESQAGEIKGDDIELLGRATGEEQLHKQLVYVGRRTITKFGCSGCHDIPGYEDVKPIGTGLADWGRKAADKLAFEQITQYILHGHGAKPGEHGDVTHDSSYQDDPTTADVRSESNLAHAELGHEMNFADYPPAIGYFMEKLFGHEREGFIWQKLRARAVTTTRKPRTRVTTSGLRMPQFSFGALDPANGKNRKELADEKREQIITFVLGLVAEPPAQQYVYKSTPRRGAIDEGLKVVEKFNCKGCHAFQMDHWDVAYQPEDFDSPPEFVDYDFLQVHPTPAQVKASLDMDARGLRHASLVGTPAIDDKTGQMAIVDPDDSPIEPGDKESRRFNSFTPWESTLINGQVYPAGLKAIKVPLDRIVAQYPTAAMLAENPAVFGGYLPKLIYSSVVAAERAINPNVKPDEAWGWLPPPLVGEGRKVQTEWLHGFLLDPHPIRPAAVLRMPKFNMSPAEATALVNYFAAIDNVNYPYEFDPRTQPSYLAAQAEAEKNPHRLADGLKIVTDNTYCVKCHLVGDFAPAGSDRAKGPRLDEVHRQLRPIMWSAGSVIPNGFCLTRACRRIFRPPRPSLKRFTPATAGSNWKVWSIYS